MKTIIQIITILCLLGIVNCGKINDTLDKVGDAADKLTDTLSDAQDKADSILGDNGDDSDIQDEDGMVILDGDSQDQPRTLLGTYNKMKYSYYYYDGSFGDGPCEESYPGTIRAYSHDYEDIIDFETNSGNLVWISTIQEDDTFDFSVRFLDEFKKPSIEMTCTCIIDEAYYNYENDQLQCSCSDQDNNSCALFYEKMN